MLSRLKRLFKPRLVAISVARDEEDVIEAFVRHTSALVDHHLIVDHCSHDRTPEILEKLLGEGLSISVFRCDDPVYNQPPLTNLLMRKAVDDFDADWIVPLDADEFAMPAEPDGLDAEDCLQRAIAGAGSHRGCLIYPFRTYHPAASDPKGELNVVERLGNHYETETGEYHKIIVARRLAEKGARIMPGNHHLYLDGELVEPTALENIVLAHYAVRSVGQYVRKIATAELGKDSFGKKRKGLGTQKTGPFELLKTDPRRFFVDVLEPARPMVARRGVYLGEPLQHTEPEDEFAATVRSLLSSSHQIARQLGAMRDKQREKGVDPLNDSSKIELQPIEGVVPNPAPAIDRARVPADDDGLVLKP